MSSLYSLGRYYQQSVLISGDPLNPGKEGFLQNIFETRVLSWAWGWVYGWWRYIIVIKLYPIISLKCSYLCPSVEKTPENHITLEVLHVGVSRCMNDWRLLEFLRYINMRLHFLSFLDGRCWCNPSTSKEMRLSCRPSSPKIFQIRQQNI